MTSRLTIPSARADELYNLVFVSLKGLPCSSTYREIVRSNLEAGGGSSPKVEHRFLDRGGPTNPLLGSEHA